METEKQQFKSTESKNEKERVLRCFNKLQCDLINSSGQNPQDWISENAKNFQEAVGLMPDIVELYARDPDAVWKKVKEAMDQKRTFH